jgi:hypothetical protein
MGREYSVQTVGVATPGGKVLGRPGSDVYKKWHEVVLGYREGAALVLLRQGVEVAGLGHRKLVADVVRAVREEATHLPAVQFGIEIAADGKLRAAALQLFEGDAQVGHEPSFSIQPSVGP